jgi:hypothetical protein
MQSLVRGVLAIAVLVTTGMAAPFPDDENSFVIVFRDGHQQTFSMAEIARIEFRTSGRGEVGRGRFLGRWRVGDGAGGHFFINLDPSGEARMSMGPMNGTWTVVDGEARITWQNGWHDAIRKVGDRYQKLAFSPEKSFNDPPSNVTDAQNLEPQPN